MIVALGSLNMFKSVQKKEFTSISKDHIGELEVGFNNKLVQVSIFTKDDEFMVAELVVSKFFNK